MLLFSTANVHAAETCENTTPVKRLFLARTVDVQQPGDLEVSVMAGQGRGEADHNPYSASAAFGLVGGWEMNGMLRRIRLPNGGADHAVDADASYRLACQDGLPTLKLNFGFHHDGGNGLYGGIAAGQQIFFGSWQAAATRNAAINTTHYSAALTFGEDFGPFALEATADDTPQGWKRWASAGMFVIIKKSFDLGLAYADGGGLNEGEKMMMVRLTTEF